MIRTQARDMFQKIQSLVNVGAVSEDMTTHNMMTGAMMNIPNNYRGLAKVTRMQDQSAKNWLGTDVPFYIDMENGESSLLSPEGDVMSVQDIMKTFQLETFMPTP